MKLVVDRLEENFVVCEDNISGEIINLDKSIFPENIKSGVAVELIDGAITILDNTEDKERIKEKMNRLWK